ncbi:MAG: hypothetical protein IH991_13905 [Planctomycetes bacterium]|nr:hypothetical protein [Planctomycetota bacterium]
MAPQNRTQLEAAYLSILERHGLKTSVLQEGMPSWFAREVFESARRDGLDEFEAREEVDEFLLERECEEHTFSTVHEFIQSIGARVEQLVHLQGASLDQPIFFGEFPLGMYAANVQCAGNGHLVLVDIGMIMCLYHAAKVYVWSWNFQTFDDAGDPSRMSTAWDTDDTLRAMATIARCYHNGNVNAAPRHQLPTDIRLWLMAAMVQNAEMWVVAHEFSHILNGDLEPELRTTWETNVGAVEIAAIRREQEFSADLTATNIMLADKNWSRTDVKDPGRNEVRALLAGIALVFGFKNTLDVFGQRVLNQSRNEDLVTHPTTFERSNAIRTAIERKMDAELLGYFDSCLSWWRNCADLVIDKADADAAPFRTYDEPL